jgi:sialate O-acetylesterase
MRIESGLLAGQVLQRRGKAASAEVEGGCSAEGEVLVTIARGAKPLAGWKQRRCGKAAGGRFRAELAGIPSGGPYAVAFTIGRERLTVREVFVGDVWVLAGQSNMQGVGNLDRAPKPHPLVRAFTMDRRWGLAREPIHHMEASPDPVHNPNRVTPEQAAQQRKTMLKGVGPGIWFGADMAKRIGVPQGLICTAHGGTSMEQWDPAKAGEGAGSLYGSMLLSVRANRQPVAGVLWYQGESDTWDGAAARYTERMQALVAAMRRDFGELGSRKDLPFLVVQIGRFIREGGDPRWWNAIQELERLLPRAIPRLDMAATIDLPLDDLIHISSAGYPRLAARLARLADRIAHGNKREQPAPSPRSVRRIPPKDYPICPVAIEVRFDHVVGGLRSAGEPTGFTFVDGEHRAVPGIYKVVLDGDRAILETSMPAERGDLRVMYGHGDNPSCTVVDGRDMAVPVFGPLPVENVPPSSGFIVTWRVTASREPEDIAKLPRPRLEDGDWERKTWAGTFVNQHDSWQQARGHAAFVTDLVAAEAMALELKIGYDGPIRVWIGDDQVLDDPKGTNPALADAVTKPFRIGAGIHRVTVLMGLNGGLAWGFFLRFGRTDGRSMPEFKAP